MASAPFQFTFPQTKWIATHGGFFMIRTKTYTLPTFHPKILAKLQKAEHSCHSCGVSFVHQMPGRGPPEQPIVLPCGHICGSRCLENRLDVPVPKCFICDRELPLRPRNRMGVHGSTDAVVWASEKIKAAPPDAPTGGSTLAAPGIAPTTHKQTTMCDEKRGMSIQDVLNDNDEANILDDDDATISSSDSWVDIRCQQLDDSNSAPATSAAAPTLPAIHVSPPKATVPDLMVQVKAAMEGGHTAEDIEAAKMLVDISTSPVSPTPSQDQPPQDPISGFNPINKPVLGPTEPQMEKAIAHVNRVYGVSLSLQDLKVALMLSDMKNGTETLLSEALSGW